MTTRPIILDAFCGAGGAAMGYHRAGFDVVGVDIKPQPRFPFDFVQDDALDFVRRHGREFDAIHASPPCQRHSRCAGMPGRSRDDYPELIGPTRDALQAAGVPWVIENVETAPLRNGITLCGQMFGLGVYRHRRFESSVMLLSPKHSRHLHVLSDGRLSKYGTLDTSPVITVAGHMFRTADGRRAMGIDWPMTRPELAEAIPPAYTEHVGRLLAAVLANREAA